MTDVDTLTKGIGRLYVNNTHSVTVTESDRGGVGRM